MDLVGNEPACWGGSAGEWLSSSSENVRISLKPKASRSWAAALQSILETAGAPIPAPRFPEVYFLTAKFTFSGLQNKKRDLQMGRGRSHQKETQTVPSRCPGLVCISVG